MLNPLPLAVARVLTLEMFALSVMFGWPGAWVSIALALLAAWLFSIAPPALRPYFCGHQVLIMTDREAQQRNAALAANGLDERWIC